MKLPEPTRQRVIRIVRLFVTAIVLFVVLRGIDFGLFARTLRSFHWYTLAIALGLQLVARALMALQITIGARAYGLDVRFARSLEINLVMTFYTLLVPGELVSGGIGWTKMVRDGSDVGGTAATFATSRLVNTILLFAIGIGLSVLDQPTEMRNLQQVLLIGLAVAGAAYVMLLSEQVARWVETMLTRCIGRSKWPKLAEAVQRVFALWAQFRSMQVGRQVALYGCGILIHAVGILSHLLVVHELHLGLSWVTIAWIRSLVLLLGLLPLSIGGFGIRESALAYVLGLYSVDRETSLVYSLVLVATVYGVGLVGAILELKDTLVHRRPAEARGPPKKVDTGISENGV